MTTLQILIVRSNILHLLPSAFLVLFLWFPFTALATGKPIIIGQAIDLSGSNGSIGRDYVAGIKTYFDSINANGGIKGRPIHYIVHDDLGIPEQSAKAATGLIENDKVDFLLGGVGSGAQKAILETPAFKRSGLILYAPLVTGEDIGNSRVLYWRPGYRDEIQYLFAHFGSLGMKEVGVVIQESAANEEAYRSVTAEVSRRGMKLAGMVRIGPNSDIAQEARRLAAARPGFVVVIADSIGTGLFLKQFRNYAGKTFVAGTSLTGLSSLVEVAGQKAMEWTVFSQVVPNPNAFSSPLQVEHANMMKKYRDEAVSSLTFEGFAAAKALVKAIEQAKNQSAALQEAMGSDRDIDLGGITIAFSPKRKHLSGYLDIALFRKGAGLMF